MKKDRCCNDHKCNTAKPYPTMQSAPYLFYDNKGVGNGGPPQGAPPVAQNPPTLVEGTTSLHFALGAMKLPDLENLLLQNPAAVHEKGFNGQTPLHKAVLGSGIEIIDLLLRYKADTNARNDYEETPFHFACKRGVAMIIKLLAENGADLNAVDKGGKGPVHHAAHGGSVHGLHFLTEVYDLQTHIRDVNLSTPLHVVAAHGHVEATKWLLRKDRCDLLAQNAHANNALHIAANAGHGWTCWKILEHGGLELLHQENREGKTPLDLVRHRDKDSKFIDTRTLLTYYTLSGKQKGAASGPVLGWYAHGLFPVLFYPLVLGVAAWTSRPGTMTLAGLILMLLILYQHSHRINHISKWPNPVFFGMFLAGMLHTSTYFYYNMLNFMHNYHPGLLYLMMLLNLTFIYSYYKLLTVDPGRATEPATKPGSLWPYTIKDVGEGGVKQEAFCANCELIPPRLTHHCKLCLHCYLNTDHHCLFLYRCIARDNHRLFIYFCIQVTMGILTFLISTATYINFLFPNSEYDKKLLGEIFEYYPWLWTVTLANAISLFWGFNLVRFQLNVVSKAQTTVYQPDGGRTTLTYKQRLYNMVYFLMGRGVYASDDKVTV